ncbi:hypothetical protein [Moraxella lacunata]
MVTGFIITLNVVYCHYIMTDLAISRGYFLVVFTPTSGKPCA